MHQITAIAKDDADDGFHKQRHHNAQQHGGTGKVDVGFFVFTVELLERQQLLGFLHKGLDYGDAGKALLRKIRQFRECLLTNLPLLHHAAADDGGGSHEEQHGNHGQACQQRIHPEHFDDGQNAQKQRVAKHHNAPAKALLHRFQIVGKQAHEVADLVDLIILAAQILAVVEHAVAQVLFHTDAYAEEAHTPQKAAEYHGQNDPNHRQAQVIQQKVHIKRQHLTVDFHCAVVDTVDQHLIQIGDHQLQVIHHGQRRHAQQQQKRIFHIITIDMSAENHVTFSFVYHTCTVVQEPHLPESITF